MKGFFRLLGLSIFLVLALAIGFNLGRYWEPKKTVEFYIEPHDPAALRKLSLSLEEKGFIYKASFFRWLATMSGLDKRIAPGYYDLDNHLGTLGILFFLRDSNAKQINITIPEGYDIYDTALTLTEAGLCNTPEDFTALAKSTAWRNQVQKKFGLPVRHSIEGFLYPDTYQLKKGSSVSLFIQVALDNFLEKIYVPYKRRLEPEFFYRTLIAASLIEKETSLASERPLVASVIENRLKKNMKLRFDPTIIYALKDLGLSKQNLKGGKINIKRSHFTLPSVFNTYYRKGLPPSPICTPSVASFKAVLTPAKTKYLFFVAKGDASKEHIFTSTYEAHRRYVEQYQRRKSKEPGAKKK